MDLELTVSFWIYVTRLFAKPDKMFYVFTDKMYFTVFYRNLIVQIRACGVHKPPNTNAHNLHQLMIEKL